MLKKLLIGIAVIIGLVLGAGFWFVSLLPELPDMEKLKASSAKDIPYIQSAIPQTRGKILAVVTSSATMGDSNKATGYELTELSRPYWVFKVNGFDVDIASIEGGHPPVVLDDDDMAEYDYAFLNDTVAMGKVKNTLHINDVNADDYQAVYFVGGKGAMFDFPDNPAVQTLVKQLYQDDKVISAVCHGPAALTNVILDNGQHLLEGKTVSSFTNDEELLLIPDAKDIFPFLLEDKLKAQGAKFNGGFSYLNTVSVDGKLITGQNPWSTWTLSEEIIKALGYTPVKRPVTPEERSVELLTTYAKHGYAQAVQDVKSAPKGHYSRMLVAMHSMVAIMRIDLIDTVQLMRLTSTLKEHDNQG